MFGSALLERATHRVKKELHMWYKQEFKCNGGLACDSVVLYCMEADMLKLFDHCFALQALYMNVSDRDARRFVSKSLHSWWSWFSPWNLIRSEYRLIYVQILEAEEARVQAKPAVKEKGEEASFIANILFATFFHSRMAAPVQCSHALLLHPI